MSRYCHCILTLRIWRSDFRLENDVEIFARTIEVSYLLPFEQPAPSLVLFSSLFPNVSRRLRHV